MFPNAGQQQIDGGSDRHAVPYQGEGSVGNELAEDGGETPQEDGAVQRDKGFGSGGGEILHTLLKNQGR